MYEKTPSDDLAHKRGHVFFLLSMSKMAGSEYDVNVRQHTPEDCVAFIKGMKESLPDSNLSYTFMYTDGLYDNATEPAVEVHTKTVNQMTRHSNQLQKLLSQEDVEAELVSWNQLILNAQGNWESEFHKLNNKFNGSKDLIDHVHSDMKALTSKENPEAQKKAHERFVLEEMLVMEKIRRREIVTPQTIEQPDFSVIAYAGAPLDADQFIIQKKGRAVKGRLDAIDKTHSFASYQADISEPENPIFYKTLESKAAPVSMSKNDNKKPKRLRRRLMQAVSYAALATSLFLTNRDAVIPHNNDTGNKSEVHVQDNIAHVSRAGRDAWISFNDNGEAITARIKENGREVLYENIEQQKAIFVSENGAIRKPMTRDDGYLMLEQSEKLQQDIELAKLKL